MKKILILNGPNLNLLGKRETEIYGTADFSSYLQKLQTQYANYAELAYFQSNVEGELIDKIQESGFSCDGIILNAGAYTHTSIALQDAIRSVTAPVVEVHISNVHQREEYRHKSMIACACKGVICGFGLDSYRLALLALINSGTTAKQTTTTTQQAPQQKQAPQQPQQQKQTKTGFPNILENIDDILKI